MGIIIVNNKDKELIQHVLHDYSRYYLLYHGGSGGEFLSYLVSEYSSKFRKINNLVTIKKMGCFWLIIKKYGHFLYRFLVWKTNKFGT